MIKQIDKKQNRLKIKKRVRAKVFGTAEKPRMSVFRSNKHIYTQLIDDVNGITLVAASTKSSALASDIAEKSGAERAAIVGKHVAELAQQKGINTVVFDRNGFRYHGQVQRLADAAREQGLTF